ncbi:unnamed protein product [Diabrotica balteata]|uniref:Uncharacterized protein n=1 Tax=Diabrotica balteata TaxID=107213 RepID=A0A9N9SSJ8_DIABA|nr:unnamed protein product [Diabrotica balteata]
MFSLRRNSNVKNINYFTSLNYINSVSFVLQFLKNGNRNQQPPSSDLIENEPSTLSGIQTIVEGNGNRQPTSSNLIENEPSTFSGIQAIVEDLPSKENVANMDPDILDNEYEEYYENIVLQEIKIHTCTIRLKSYMPVFFLT